MRLTRPVLVAVLSWLAVVAVGSTMVWAVISRAGEGLVTTVDDTGGTSTSSPAVPGATFQQSPSNAPSDGSPAVPGGSGSTGSSGTAGSPSSSPSSSGPATDPPSSAASPDAPQSQRGVWQGVGGTVVAECSGFAIHLVSASADTGFRAQVSNPGPEELEVEFEGREDSTGSSAHVRATCVGGSPRFTSEVESEGADD